MMDDLRELSGSLPLPELAAKIINDTGYSARLTVTSSLCRRCPAACSASAASCLPVPGSPSSSTGLEAAAARVNDRHTERMAWLQKTNLPWTMS